MNPIRPLLRLSAALLIFCAGCGGAVANTLSSSPPTTQPAKAHDLPVADSIDGALPEISAVTVAPEQPNDDVAEPGPDEPAPACELVAVPDVYFQSGQWELVEGAYDELVERFRVLIPRLGQVDVGGHTDNVPAVMGNQELSERRAHTVAQAVLDAEIPARRLNEPVGFAESRPVASNDTAEGRQANRRVEVITCSEVQP